MSAPPPFPWRPVLLLLLLLAGVGALILLAVAGRWGTWFRVTGP